jgi:hypothetical protein
MYNKQETVFWLLQPHTIYDVASLLTIPRRGERDREAGRTKEKERNR